MMSRTCALSMLIELLVALLAFGSRSDDRGNCLVVDRIALSETCHGRRTGVGTWETEYVAGYIS